MILQYRYPEFFVIRVICHQYGVMLNPIQLYNNASWSYIFFKYTGASTMNSFNNIDESISTKVRS